MTDNPLGGGGGDGGAGAGGAGGGGAGDGGGAGGAPAWNAALPETLREDPALKPFASLDALASSYLETKAMVGRGLVMPKDDADEAGWNTVYEKLGRPADAKDYEIPLPEGTTPELADAFRPVAHKLGLSAKQAKGVVEFNNAMVAQMSAQGAAEVTALKSSMGAGFAPALEKAKAAAKAFGVDDAMADALDLKLGSGKMLQLFMNIGAKMGEHGRIEAGGGGPGGAGDPLAERTALTRDKDFVAKLDAGDAAARQRWNALNAAIAEQQHQA